MPSGRIHGHWKRTSAGGFRRLTVSTGPPVADTRRSPFSPLSAKRIVPSVPHVPPVALGISASVRTVPDARSIRRSCVGVMNPSERPSGAQNNSSAPSVPGSGFAASSLSCRIHSNCPDFPEATNATRVPSGETDTE